MSTKLTLKGRKLAKGDERYDRISPKQKILLIKHVISDKFGIKKASDMLGINYSTAKTLIRRFKTRGHKLNKEFIIGCSQWFDHYENKDLKRCTYQSIDNSDKVLDSQNSSQIDLSQFDKSFQQNGTQMSTINCKIPLVAIIQQVIFSQ